MDKTQPLWLPQGSVQALLAIALTLTFCYLAITGVIAPEAVKEIVLVVLSFYFIVKAAAQGAVSGADQTKIITAALNGAAPAEGKK